MVVLYLVTLLRKDSRSPVKGVLAYTRAGTDVKHTDFHVIETNYDFGTQALII